MASFGENLRRERELRGITLHQIADSTKISVRFLQALEQDRVEVLPGGLFRRSFVREYARHVGLDAERLVAEFVALDGERPTDKTSTASRPWFSPSVFGLVGLILLGGLFLARRPPRTPAPGPGKSIVHGAPVVLPSDRVYPPPASTAAKGPSPAAGPENLVLTLSARQTTWVAVRVDGLTVLDRVLSEGESQTLEAQGEIVLSVGNAGGLAFTVNDRPGVPLGRSGEVRRNIVITRKSLPSLVEDAVPGTKVPRSS